MLGRRSIAATVSVSPDRIIWENGYMESLNGTLNDELLNGEIFYTVAEARMLIERWREHYNRVRPYSALGYRPPAPEAIAAGPSSASLRAVQQRHSDRTTTASTVDSTAGEGHKRLLSAPWAERVSHKGVDQFSAPLSGECHESSSLLIRTASTASPRW